MDGHQVELRGEPRRVEVVFHDTVVASSTRTVALAETGLPVRYYFPRDDVVMEHLDATKTETVCPFKGSASYWSVRIGDDEHHDLAWAYESPIEGLESIVGHICFYAEHTDHRIDGESLQRPETPWSKSKAS